MVMMEGWSWTVTVAEVRRCDATSRRPTCATPPPGRMESGPWLVWRETFLGWVLQFRIRPPTTEGSEEVSRQRESCLGREEMDS